MAASQVVKVIFDGKDQTSKAINSLKGNLNQADKAVGQIKKSLGGMTAAIGLAAGAAGFGLLTRNALQTADALAKTSSKLGVATGELFRFQTMAELSGISTDTANMALQRFTRRTAEAAMGTGEAKAALIELGVSAAELQKLPLSERMKVLADAFAGVEDESDQLRLAFKLFDSEGAAMVNMLKEGSGGIIEMERELGDLGHGLDDSVGNVESFNDAVTLMSAKINGAMIEGLGQATPVLEEATDKLAALIIPLTGGLLDGLTWLLDNLEMVTNVVKGFAGAWALLKFGQLVTGLAALAKAIGLVKVAMVALRVAMGPVGLVLSAIGAAAAYFQDDLEDLGSELGIFGKDAKKATGETEDLENAIDQLQEIVVTVERKPLPELRKEIKTLSKEEREAAVETLELKEALDKLREKAIAPQRDLDQFIKKMGMLKKEIEETGDPTGELTTTMQALIEEFTGVESEAEKVRQEIEKVKTAMEAASAAGLESSEIYAALEDQLDDLGGELVDAIKETSKLTDNQKELLESATELETGIADLNQDLEDLKDLYDSGAISSSQYSRAVKSVTEEINELNDASLTDFERAVKDAFDATPVGEFIAAVNAVSGSGGPLSTFIDKLTGTSGVQAAIGNCFGTGPVNDFGDAIKNLFDGADSPFGAFGGALVGLTSALDGFFSGAGIKFNSFKDAIIGILNEIAASAIASVGINFLKKLIPGINTGGLVGEFAEGGRVFGVGGPKEDKVLARLSAGEYVINAASVSKFGTGFFDMLNDGKMEMPGFQGGGFVGFDPFSITITSILNKIFGGIFGAIFGGESESRKKFKIRSGTLNYVQESFLEVLQQIGDNYGFGRRLYRRTKPKRQGGIDLMEDKIIPEIMNAILPPGADLGHHEKVAEGINAIGPGFAEMLYNFLVPRLLDIRFRTVDFNMDDEVYKLFNRANSIAGGSLTLNERRFGGPVEAGSPTLVGERGPELFVPDSRGRVSPIARDGGKELVAAVREVKQEVAALRRQMDRQNPVQLKGGRN